MLIQRGFILFTINQLRKSKFNYPQKGQEMTPQEEDKLVNDFQRWGVDNFEKICSCIRRMSAASKISPKAALDEYEKIGNEIIDEIMV